MSLFDSLFKKLAGDSADELLKQAKEKLNEAAEKMKAELGEDFFKQAAKKEEKPKEEKPQAAKPQEVQEEEYPEPVVVQLKNKTKESFVPDPLAVPSDCPDHGSAAYFEDLLAKNFPGVTVEKEVPLEALTADLPVKRMPVSLLLSKGGVRKLAVMLVPKNRYRVTKVVNTMNACEDQGIRAIRFFREFENTAPYVVGRIRAIVG
ncbi:MAG: hypothetical protein J6U26_04565 [Lachnospiraceae bacterium]|nr:hypothetical protein [Lachnospiraceae bacterium]